jgi:ribonuclease J
MEMRNDITITCPNGVNAQLIEPAAVNAHSSAPTPGALNARIHRGAREIGGNCVELEYQGSRIVLDVGKPLWAGWDEVVPLPKVPGLDDGSDTSLAGVIISHPHLDHYGLIDQVDPAVPIYIGREASLLVTGAKFFSAAGVNMHPTGYLVDRVPLRVGAFTVTPYLMDHSGFDSYSLLVEAGGHRLFYTGDLRGHGRKAHLFEELLADPPRPIDVLLCEGTHVHAAGIVDEPARSENDVELSLAQRMRETSGAISVVSSAQNIDRLVTVYRASRRVGRTLVTDLYSASLVHAIGRRTIPQPGFPDYKVYVPQRQRVQVKNSGQFDRMGLVRGCRVFLEWLSDHRGEITLLLPTSAVSELLRAGVLAEGSVVWSMWPGYLKESSGKRVVRALDSARVPLDVDHASGHASVADLKRLAEALDPRQVVPIHTEGADQFEGLFKGVVRRDDGEWWSV